MSFVNRVERLDRFHFDNDAVFNHQIDAISDFEFLSFIDDRQRNFSRNVKTSSSEFVGEARLISALEKSRAEKRVDFSLRNYDGPCDVVNPIALGASRSSHASGISDFPCVSL